jgi:hypothetical protein
MEARFKKALRTLIQFTNKIRADRTIPEDLKKALLDINEFLRSEVKRYDEVRKILRSPYRRPGDLFARMHAKRQTRDIEDFSNIPKRIIDENDQKKISAIGR